MKSMLLWVIMELVCLCEREFVFVSVEKGKTTLMNILCGMIEQTSGQILILNQDTRDEIHSIRSLIAYCPQRTNRFDEDLFV